MAAVKIIDGHNLIGAAQPLGLALDQEDKEERLLRLLATWRSRRRGRNRVLVVFDGHHGRLAAGPRRYSHAGVDVEWAIGEPADDVIVRRVREAPQPREVEVVTSDGVVIRNVAACGARTVRSQEFVDQVRRALAEAPEAEKPPPPGPAEVADWLERFDKKR